jgi:hypothetical protein
MEPELSSPLCSGCGSAATLASKLTRFRRGDKVLPFEGYVWQCSAGCADPVDGTVPYQFSTPPLMAWVDGAAASLWLERFGEPMPPSLRSRVPDEQRTVRVPLLLTRREAERLDQIRGGRSRAEFVRRLINESGAGDRRG